MSVKFRKLRLPVFRMTDDGLESFRVKFCESKIQVDHEPIEDGVVEFAIAKAGANKKSTCIVEDEHDNRLRFTYQSETGVTGFIGYLREILDENQFAISKNMSVVDSISVSVSGESDEILIKLSLDVNPAMNTGFNF